MALLNGLAAAFQPKPIEAIVILSIGFALLAVGTAVALNQRQLASRIASIIAGPSGSNPSRPQPSTDRFWAILPFSLGLAALLASVALVLPFNDAVGGAAGAALAAAYYIAMMRLAWIYTPPKRRRIGPFFWTMRAAAIPAAFFFSFGLLVTLVSNSREIALHILQSLR